MKNRGVALPPPGVVVAAFTLILALASFSFAAEEPSAHGAALKEGSSAIPEDYNCINCHEMMDDDYLTPPVVDWKESIHRQVGVKCADCHGGDPANEDMAMDPAAGFIGVPSPQDVPKLCAKCHADTKLMRVYNQRADQYSLYEGSVHGRKLLAGDEAAANCVSCHGKHKILPSKDPNSTVARKNVPETCGSCHSNEEVFGDRRIPHNQLELYKRSWHYQLLAKGDLLVPTCVDCHGNHGIISPRSERVQTVCFNCHSQQAEYYKASAHWVAYKKNGEPICITCHNNHDIQRPSVDKFTAEGENDCIWCHEPDGKAYKTGLELKQTVVASVSAVTEAKESLEALEEGARGGFEITDLVEKIEKARAKLSELHTLTHKMSLEDLKKRSDDVMQTAQYVSDTVEGMWAELRTRKLGLVIAWVVFLGFVGALVAKSKTLERRED